MSSGSPSEAFLRELANVSAPSPPRIDVAPTSKIGRFRLQRCLGQGGFGTVYEAHDEAKRSTVALKVLHTLHPQALEGFKREFRAMVGLAHPNLVQLYELREDAGRWFYTMELVPGQPVHAYARGSSDDLSPPAGLDPTFPSPAPGERPEAPRRHAAAPAYDERKLRHVFRQIAEGLGFLHGAGRLHRDLKPSNVLVARDGRVVLLDFGLIVDLFSGEGASVGTVAGTPAYMAPEQARGEKLGPHADWYAVGVMLFEALTGTLPFDGSVLEIMNAKCSRSSEPPSARTAGVPEDLEHIAISLLSREPSAREDGAAKLLSWGAPAPEVRRRETAQVMVGRRQESARLDAAFDAVREGRTAVALVHGASGIGKSTLVDDLIRRIRDREPNALIFSSCCFAQESVPYEALDGLVDAAVRHLRRRPPHEIEVLLPRDASALADLFPAFGSVPGARVTPRRSSPADPAEHRRRAFGALRELLVRLGDRTKLVLSIDDLQWAGEDSAALIARLLRAPDAPALLLVAAYRRDEVETSGCLRALLPELRQMSASGLTLVEVPVDRLAPEDASALALELLADGARGADEELRQQATVIAAESEGSPFLLGELARARELAHPGAPAADLVAARLADLSGSARDLLETLAVHAMPIDLAVAAEAAGAPDGGWPALQALLNARLARVRGGRESLESYHDKIREAVAAKLTPETRKLRHARLAQVLEQRGADDELLVRHLAGAGETSRAAEHALRAAEKAEATLAFEHAAGLHEKALELLPRDDPRRPEIFEKAGDSYAHAGRSVDAAREYLAAIDAGAGKSRVLDLRRKASEELLISGHLEQGLSVLGETMAALGETVPRSRASYIARSVGYEVALRARGVALREGRTASPEELVRIDAVLAAALGLTLADPVRSIYFTKRVVWLALDAGEPSRLLRALALDLPWQVMLSGPTPSAHEKAMHAVAEVLANRFGDPSRMLATSLGLMESARTDFRASAALLARAEAEVAGTQVAWRAISASRYFLLVALMWTGEWTELERRQQEYIEHASARGNRFVESAIKSTTGPFVAVLRDDLEGANRIAQEGEALWSKGDSYQTMARLTAAAEVALYEAGGTGPRAQEIVDESWSVLERAGYLRREMRAFAVRAHYTAGRAAIAAARSDRTLLARARHAAKVIRGHGLMSAEAFAAPIEAGIAAVEGQRARALACLERAQRSAESIGYAGMALAAQHRRGELLGGPEGRVLVEAAATALSDRGVVAPAKLVAMYVPGLT